MPKSPKKDAPKWHHPSEVMKLYNVKRKKKALQSRISGAQSGSVKTTVDKNATLEDILAGKKRRNPFAVGTDTKKTKQDVANIEESSDQTLFKLLNQPSPAPPLASSTSSYTSFQNILNQVKEQEVVVVKEQGKIHIPTDWALKTKVRLYSDQQFPWNQRLKISEEASGITGFVRCLNTTTTTTLDTAPNAKFHQCCMYWQHPSLPWLSLFPRSSRKAANASGNITITPAIKASLQSAWSDSLRSLYQLIRTKQCPYFYVCTNNFTALFRAAGICGFSDIHAIVTPTTRGFRSTLRQEEIEFTMPLKKRRASDENSETIGSVFSDKTGDSENPSFVDEDDQTEDQWLESLGVNADDIRQFNSTQAKIVQKSECDVDNSEQSLILIEGVEVHPFYNYLLNCKSATSTTGPLAGIPPTLLAPVAFSGATLNTLKVRESKANVDSSNYHTLELAGPILPSTVHNLFSINTKEHNVSATFLNIPSTAPFSKITKENSSATNSGSGNLIFNKENLSDCGLDPKVLELFCSPDHSVTNVECLKYNSDSKTYSWT